MNKTVHQIFERYACIPRVVVEIYCKLCPICLLKLVQSSQPRLKPIRSEGFWSHTQIDLIDMRHNPSDGFKYICHLEDHFTKFHVLWKMKQKCADEVVAGLYEKVFPYFGIPKIFQSDLAGKVISVSGEKDMFYEIATEHGILEIKYRSSDLEIYQSSVKIDVSKKISLTAAAGKVQIRTAPTDTIETPVSCKCNGKCDGRCKCRQSNSTTNLCTNK
jgi:hypothetical protein